MVYMYTLLEFLRNERFYINGKSTPVDRTWGGGCIIWGEVDLYNVRKNPPSLPWACTLFFLREKAFPSLSF